MTSPGGGTNVGEIIAYLRLNRSDWDRELTEAGRRADELARHSPDIRIRTNAASVLGQLEAVARAENAVRNAQQRAEETQTRLSQARQRYASNSSQVRDAERAAERATRDLALAQSHLGNSVRQAELAQQRLTERLNQSGNAADRAGAKFHLLADSILLLGAAAIPLGAVIGGALVGLVPTLGVVALGISGIKDEIKSGAIEGTRGAKDLKAYSDELATLKAQASGGLLNGLHEGLIGARPLFRELNVDTAVFGQQLGGIAQHAGPALLSLFTQLNPLFVTFGTMLVHGAAAFERWTQSSNGVSGFVSYVQHELPSVLDFLGSLMTLISHLAQAGAGFGGGLLTAFTLIIRAIDALPIGVLQVLIPLLAGIRIGFLALRGVDAIVSGVSTAFDRISNASGRAARDVAVAAAQQQLTAAQTAAAVAAEAESIAASRAAEAEIAADAALAQENAARTVGGAVLAEARIVAEAKVAEAEAYAAAAEAAALSAAETAAVAAAAATAVAEAGTVAEVGWAAMLGPIAALAVGIGILGFTFLGMSHHTAEATAANQAYTESVKQSTNALNAANLNATAKNLADSKSLETLSQLTAANRGLGISQLDLTRAVNGTDAQYTSVITKLQAVAAANRQYRTENGKTIETGYNAQGKAADKLIGTLTNLRSTLGQNIRDQIALNKVMREQQALYLAGSPAARKAAADLHLTGSAYLTARDAAKKSAESTREQIAAWQAASDAASLFQQALDSLAGNDIGVAEAQTSLRAANLAVADAFKKGAPVIRGGTAAAVAHQQALQGQARAAQQAAEAVGKETKSGQAAVRSYKEAKAGIEAQLAAHHKLTPAVQAYINKLYDVSAIQGFISKHPTLFDANTSPAEKKMIAIQRQIDNIKQGKSPTVDANTAAGRAKIADLQRQMDALRDKTVRINVAIGSTNEGNRDHAGLGATPSPVVGPTHLPSKADGGKIVGPGGPRSDSVIIAASNGEFMSTAVSTARNQSALEAGNRGAKLGVVGYADGGLIGTNDIYRVGKGYGFQGQYYADRKSAESARRDAERSAAAQRKYDAGRPSDLTQSHNGVTGFASIIRAQIPASRKAARELSQAINDAIELKGVEAQLDKTNKKLADMKAFRAGIESTLAGATDTTKAGSVTDLLSTLQGGTSANNAYAANLNKLRGEAKGDKPLLDFINEQAAQGNTTTIGTLATASKSDLLGRVTKGLKNYDSSLLAGGNAATTTKYGKSIGSEEQLRKDEIAERRHLVNKIDKLVAQIGRATKRPVEIKIGAEVVAHAVIHSHEFEGVWDELSDVVHYGRKKG